ncbi:hypothetical protein [Bartonella florencae]|uniref:hypothetical protein n=1 Tax=Bartonella florencae TaxID=928210 RepID=UPI00031ED169
MRFSFYFILILFLFFSVGKQSFASEPTTIRKAELLRLIVDVNHAVKNGNFASTSAYMPDKLYEKIMSHSNMTVDNSHLSFLKELRVQFENLSPDAYHLNATGIDYLQTDNGTFYALIPTEQLFDDRALFVEYKTLAIFNEKQWYLIYGGHKTVKNPVFWKFILLSIR